MSVQNKKFSIAISLALVACFLCAIIVGCNVNVQVTPGTTGASGNTQGTNPGDKTPPADTEGVVISPTDDEENPGSIEIILPNEDDGEEGDVEIDNNSGNSNGNGNSGNSDGNGDSGNTGGNGNSGNTGDSGNSDNTNNGNSDDDSDTTVATETTQGNDGNDDTVSSPTDYDDPFLDEEPDLVIDFDDLFKE